MSAGKRFALLGVGYIAPRHIDAIRAVGGHLVAACDTHDVVGVLDRYTRDVAFFRGENEWREGPRPAHDFCVIATPNDRHLSHAWSALGWSDVICEKPVCLSVAGVDELRERERRTGRRVFPVLQLRHDRALRNMRALAQADEWDVRIDYAAPRGPWYAKSWKADPKRSGGIIFNLGVHLLDAMCWMFGAHERAELATASPTTAAGTVQFARAHVAWRLSTEGEAQRRFVFTRRGTKAQHVIDVSASIVDLHAEVYRAILARTAPGLGDALDSVRLCETLTEQATRARAST